MPLAMQTEKGHEARQRGGKQEAYTLLILEDTMEGTPQNRHLEKQISVGEYLAVLIFGDGELAAATSHGVHEELHHVAAVHSGTVFQFRHHRIEADRHTAATFASRKIGLHIRLLRLRDRDRHPGEPAAAHFVAQIGEDGERRTIDTHRQQCGTGLLRHEAGGLQRFGIGGVVIEAAAVEHHTALMFHEGADEVHRCCGAGIVDEHRIGERTERTHPPFMLESLVRQQGHAMRQHCGDEQRVDDGTRIMQDERAFTGSLEILAAAQFHAIKKFQQRADYRTEHTNSSGMPL